MLGSLPDRGRLMRRAVSRLRPGAPSPPDPSGGGPAARPEEVGRLREELAAELARLARDGLPGRR